ncbi:hypothetical protein FH972_022588 [Carpinus fangiana]|uniref:Integral membrane protein n=1 Tax=Carpinus fangiana TaxID=176857 RepID=A0A5N6KSP0_9ROSI|nr:hypothetical protein FH972_022588 [Carpinus fangiana]
MLPLRKAVLSSAPLLLALLLPALALAQHSHNEELVDSGMSGMDAAPESPAELAPDAPPSYWMHPERVSMVYAHIALSILAWVIVMPLAVMLSIARSKLKVVAQFAFVVVNALCVFTGILYNTSTPDLYENNSHHKAGWIISLIATGWAVMGLITLYSDSKSDRTHQYRPLLQPVTQQAMEEYDQFNGQKPEDLRWSGDSGQGTERNTNSLCHSSRSNSWNSETGSFPTHHNQEPYPDVDDEPEDTLEKRRIVPYAAVDGFLSKHIPRYASGVTLKAFDILYATLTRFQVIMGFVALMTGMVTYGGIARDNNVFTVLAHFIKGGIFFWYGLLALGRWMGCFSDFGWAWNSKPGAEIVGKGKARMPSAEFSESFLIWLYGVTNVFLEHLGAWGGEWSATDLEHVSITIMFAGGGMLGMLIESTTVRKLLAASFSTPERQTEGWKQPDTYKHSMNPIPALIIMLLGKMMSSHTQHSATSGMIHSQWGNLFMMGSLARGATYIIMWLKPPTGYLPSRPPSELIASFCLVSGGMLFMASNGDTVVALESYNLDAMFIYTVVMGLTSALMAWEVIVIAFKGWAVKRGQNISAVSALAPVA